MTGQSEKPKLSVVAQNTSQQIETNDAQQQVNAALLQLAANIIRVVRGAGRPEELLSQCADVVNSAVDYRDAAGRLPSPATLASAIHLERELIDYGDTFWAGRKLAYRRIVRGSLQVARPSCWGNVCRSIGAKMRSTTRLRNLIASVRKSERSELRSNARRVRRLRQDRVYDQVTGIFQILKEYAVKRIHAQDCIHG
ncbi:hypothetical protein [Rhizobium sp. 1399]|uniref:hypothetical protein n=1 Tax=Rhizobium sp. 1399 TaxID=2817758 RepID=UPI00286C224C|nr:hypothetical protein [Rhizobium sp. 1399]